MTTRGSGPYSHPVHAQLSFFLPRTINQRYHLIALLVLVWFISLVLRGTPRRRRRRRRWCWCWCCSRRKGIQSARCLTDHPLGNGQQPVHYDTRNNCHQDVVVHVNPPAREAPSGRRKREMPRHVHTGQMRAHILIPLAAAQGAGSWPAQR